MKAILAITVLLTFALPRLALAESPGPKYTTLVIQYSGEVIGGSALPVIITTSQEEGEWYRQHFSPDDVTFHLAQVQVVPQSVLNEITGLPLLKPALERAKPVDDEPKTAQNARFTAGVGHDYANIILEKQPSKKILKGIDRIVAKYPSLKGELHEIEYQLK
jgi:hypothetical protein